MSQNNKEIKLVSEILLGQLTEVTPKTDFD